MCRSPQRAEGSKHRFLDVVPESASSIREPMPGSHSIEAPVRADQLASYLRYKNEEL